MRRGAERDRQREEKKLYSWWSEYAKARQREMNERQRAANLHAWVVAWARRNWPQRERLTGPISDELDPRNYADPESYAEALLALGSIPREEPPWGLVPTGSR